MLVNGGGELMVFATVVGSVFLGLRSLSQPCLGNGRREAEDEEEKNIEQPHKKRYKYDPISPNSWLSNVCLSFLYSK